MGLMKISSLATSVVFFVIGVFSMKMQGVVISVLVGLILGTTLPLSLPRNFADDHDHTEVESGLGVNKKYRIFAFTLLAFVSIMILEQASFRFSTRT